MVDRFILIIRPLGFALLILISIYLIILIIPKLAKDRNGRIFYLFFSNTFTKTLTYYIQTKFNIIYKY